MRWADPLPVKNFKIRWGQAFVICLMAFKASLLMAAQLDDLYGPLIKSGQSLLTLRGEYYSMWEKGHHGSASFDFFHSRPHEASLLSGLRFAPIQGLDVELGYQYTFPQRYDRPTENNSDIITSYQRYSTEGLSDFTLNTRFRQGEGEYYLDVLEKRHKSRWDFSVSQTAPPILFNYFQSNYEDIAIGARFAHHNAPGEFSSEWELGYKNGRLDRVGTFYVADIQHRSYHHRTHEHFTPRVLLRVGLNDQLQAEGGLAYTSPMRYQYDFRQYKDSGLTNFISGNYTWDSVVKVPMALRYYPSEDLNMSMTLDYTFIKQSLSYWEMAESGILTEYPSKKLKYYNLKPKLEVIYLTTPTHERVGGDDLLTGQFLVRNQWRASLNVMTDRTSLKKNGANGAQNIVDPYNVYLYPVENFVSGTEYAAFFSGNTALTPANVSPQNYIQTGGSINYGINDGVELGLGSGFRGESRLHQFSLNDLSDRYYIFKPYYYVDVSAKFRLTKSSTVSFNVHFVPDYKTILNTTSNPEIFTDHTRYIEAGMTFKKSF